MKPAIVQFDPEARRAVSTKEFWEARYGRELSESEIMEIERNVRELLALLGSWRESNSGIPVQESASSSSAEPSGIVWPFEKGQRKE